MPLAKSGNTIMDSWKLFFPDHIIEHIVRCTNIHLLKMREENSRDKFSNNTTLEEIKALFGLLYMAGIVKAHYSNLQELWAEDGSALECFRAVMLYPRFCTLLRALKFDDPTDVAKRKATDRLAPIRKLLEEFVRCCKSNYQVGKYTTLDQMLEPFHGRCKFRRAKCGFKVFALVDTHMLYTSNLEIYTGQQSDNATASVIKRLVAPILNTGRNITMDSYFTSVPVAVDLFKQKTTVVGTIQNNKKEIPNIFSNIKDRPLYSSMFAYAENSVLVSYVPEGNKNVLLFSTLHSHETDEVSGDCKQPNILKFYSKTKGAVNSIDKLKNTYCLSQISCRWPVAVFFLMMKIGGFNSRIIYSANTNKELESQTFFKSLALELIKPQLIICSYIPNLLLDFITPTRKIVSVQTEGPKLVNIPGMCSFCPRRKNRRTKKMCGKCLKYMCTEHSNYTCPDCIDGKPNQGRRFWKEDNYGHEIGCTWLGTSNHINVFEGYDHAKTDESETEDECEHSDHCTETEQSASDHSDIEEGVAACTNSFYTGRDMITKWTVHPSTPTIDTQWQNLPTYLLGVTPVARNAITILDSWKLFFPDHTIEHIARCTNIYLLKMRGKNARAEYNSDTTPEEIRSLLGLLYMAGVMKAQYANMRELWAEDGSTPECFRTVMPYPRFNRLLQALRFDNSDDIAEHRVMDSLAPIRHLFEEFVDCCRSNYQVGKCTTLDEMLEPFHGRCKFRRYIANKQEYGIKVYALVDSHMLYTSNLEICTGQQTDNTTGGVVKRLVAPILNTGRNVTMDRYFTSLPLAVELYEQKTTLIGTINKNTREMPQVFLNTKNRPVYSTMFAFAKYGALVSYIPKANRNVLILSTLHSEVEIDKATNDFKKPKILTFYNKTKGAVDTVDEQKNVYSISKTNCKWPLTIFLLMMNIGSINSQIIYSANTSDKMERRAFLKTLSHELIKPFIVNRSAIPNLPLHFTAPKRKAETQGEMPKRVHVPGMCSFCPRRKNRRTKKMCGNCPNYMCTEHSNYTCPNCASEESNK